MSLRRAALVGLGLALLVACGAGEYAEEKTVLTTVTKAMETLNSSMASAGSPEAVAKLLTTFTGQIEKVAPKMKEMSDAHPDWTDNPPEELKGAFESFKSASAEFSTKAVPKAMQLARDHAESSELRTALEKFNSVVSDL